MSPEASPNQQTPREDGVFDLLAEALLLETRVRESIGLESLQGNERFKRRLVREMSIGLVLGSRELGLDVPRIYTLEYLEDGRKDAIAAADWNPRHFPKNPGEIIFIQKYIRNFVTGIYRYRPYYFVVAHEMYHIHQMMTDLPNVRADYKLKDWGNTNTEKEANFFGNLIVGRYSDEVRQALQDLPSPT